MPGTMLDVYTITETSGEKNRWTKVGVAFVNRDRSLNIKLDALPINGTLHVRQRKQQDGEGSDHDPDADR